MSGPALSLWRLDRTPRRSELVRAEARALGLGDEVAPGLYLARRAYVPGRAAFGCGGGTLLGSGPPEAIALPAGGRRVHVVRGPWKVPGNPAELLRRLGSEVRPAPRGCPLELYAAPGRWFLVRAASPAAPAYAPPRLLHRTSSSLEGRVARAVVNLVARPGERVIDPVCGTGVLLVEAARIGCRAQGSDLNAKACHAARANLAALGLKAEVRVRDALALAPEEPPCDALVGDLPYGLRLEAGSLEAFARALPRLAGRWALVAHRDLSEAFAAAGHPLRAVVPVPKPTFVRYVHLGGEDFPPGGGVDPSGTGGPR